MIIPASIRLSVISILEAEDWQKHFVGGEQSYWWQKFVLLASVTLPFIETVNTAEKVFSVLSFTPGIVQSIVVDNRERFQHFVLLTLALFRCTDIFLYMLLSLWTVPLNETFFWTQWASFIDISGICLWLNIDGLEDEYCLSVLAILVLK